MVLPPPRYRPDDDQHDMKWLLLFQRWLFWIQLQQRQNAGETLETRAIIKTMAADQDKHHNHDQEHIARTTTKTMTKKLVTIVM